MQSKKLVNFTVVVMMLIFSAVSFSAESPEFQAVLADCNSGMTQQCLDAGIALTKGQYKKIKVTKDKAKAKQYISQAVTQGQKNCMRGDNLDCYTLGLLFFEGGGVVPTDIPRGLDFLQKSCRGGYSKACAWLDNSGLGRGGK